MPVQTSRFLPISSHSTAQRIFSDADTSNYPLQDFYCCGGLSSSEISNCRPALLLRYSASPYSLGYINTTRRLHPLFNHSPETLLPICDPERPQYRPCGPRYSHERGLNMPPSRRSTGVPFQARHPRCYAFLVFSARRYHELLLMTMVSNLSFLKRPLWQRLLLFNLTSLSFISRQVLVAMSVFYVLRSSEEPDARDAT